VNLTAGTVERNVRLGPFVHGNVDYDEVRLVEEIMMKDPLVQAEITKLGLPKDTVVCADPWIYGKRRAAEPRRCIA
jgi:primary-amine oxidase